MNKPYIWLLCFSGLASYAQTEAQLDSIAAAFDVHLGEVVIKTNAPVFKQNSDKLVFNIENSVLSSGSTVLEVLSRAPGVVVSQDGELSLKGRNGVSVMINGKLSQLSSKELVNLLRSTNSSVVKNIEIITNPSAKYDAAGNAGIINIVLKKYALEGLNGSYYVSGGHGRKNRFNTGLNLSYTHKNVSVYGDYNYTFRGEEERKNFEQVFYNAQNPMLIDRQALQHSVSNEPLTSNNFKMGVDYTLSSKTTIGFLVDAKIGRYEDYSTSSNLVYKPMGVLYTDVLSNNANKEHWYDFTYSLSGTHVFNDKNYKVDVDLDYENSEFKSNQEQRSTLLVNLGNDNYANRRGIIPSKLKNFTGKLDFTLPFNDKNTLETGWKTNVKSNDNPSSYQIEENQDWIIDPKATNHYTYKEQIHALYANYKLTLTHWSFQAGLRSEYTHTDIHQKTTSEAVKNEYTNLFPSASIKYESDNLHGFYVSYSKRINRPSHFDLNPFRFYDDPFNYWQGNPNLKPEFTHASELGYTWSKYIIASVFYSLTQDVMTEVYDYQQDTGILVKSQDNLNRSYHYGINLTGNIEPTSWWSSTTMFNLFNNKYEGNYQDTAINSSQVAFSINAQNTFSLIYGTKAEVNAQYFSKSNIGLYKREGYFDLSIGVSKGFAKDKATIKLAVSDVLNTKNYDIIGTNFNSKIKQNFDLDSRIITLSFTYKL